MLINLPPSKFEDIFAMKLEQSKSKRNQTIHNILENIEAALCSEFKKLPVPFNTCTIELCISHIKVSEEQIWLCLQVMMYDVDYKCTFSQNIDVKASEFHGALFHRNSDNEEISTEEYVPILSYANKLKFADPSLGEVDFSELFFEYEIRYTF